MVTERDTSIANSLPTPSSQEMVTITKCFLCDMIKDLRTHYADGATLTPALWGEKENYPALLVKLAGTLFKAIELDHELYPDQHHDEQPSHEEDAAILENYVERQLRNRYDDLKKQWAAEEKQKSKRNLSDQVGYDYQ